MENLSVFAILTVITISVITGCVIGWFFRGRIEYLEDIKFNNFINYQDREYFENNNIYVANIDISFRSNKLHFQILKGERCIANIADIRGGKVIIQMQNKDGKHLPIPIKVMDKLFIYSDDQETTHLL